MFSHSQATLDSIRTHPFAAEIIATNPAGGVKGPDEGPARTPRLVQAVARGLREQGTVLMPLNFILLTHYVYLRGDPHRWRMLGVGELRQPGKAVARCAMCEQLYPVWMQQRPDGYCRSCQLVRQLPDEGRDRTDESVGASMELSAARRQFEELDEDNDGVLSEKEVHSMGKR